MLSKRNISIICVALCVALSGGYLLRQNLRLAKAYEKADIYDYIPAEESFAVLEINPGIPIDSLAQQIPALRKAIPLSTLWNKVCEAANLSLSGIEVFSFTESGEPAIWHKVTRREQKTIKKILPRLLSYDYRPVEEKNDSITVSHYPLHNGTFLHLLEAPGVIALSFDTSLFREALQTIDRLNRRERFTHTLRTLDSDAPARLLKQIPGKRHRHSGIWQGENVYIHASPLTISPDSATILETR